MTGRESKSEYFFLHSVVLFLRDRAAVQKFFILFEFRRLILCGCGRYGRLRHGASVYGLLCYGLRVYGLLRYGLRVYGTSIHGLLHHNGYGRFADFVNLYLHEDIRNKTNAENREN